MKVLSAQFSHETNTFSRIPTDLAAFRQRVFVEHPNVAERFAGTRTELGAHIAAAQARGWELLQPIAAHATPSGLVSRDMLELVVDRLVEAAAQADGAMLALHGAMVAEGVDDPEGYLLERLRAAMGEGKPIVVTLDMHANVTRQMAAHANALIAYRSYPHVDQFEVATEGAALMQRLLSGAQPTRTHLFRLPMLDGCDHGRTHDPGGVMPRVLALAEELRQREPAIDFISVTAGFPWSDIEEAGPAVTVSGCISREAAQAHVQPLLDVIWSTRDQRSVALVPLDALAATIQSHLDSRAAGAGPVVVADFSDNPGHGAPGDSIAIVRTLLDSGIREVAVGCICDPQAVQACIEAGEGAALTLSFGNKAYPELYGEPCTALAVVEKLADGNLTYRGPMRKGLRVCLGPTAVIRIGGMRVVLATNNLQVQDLEYFAAFGIDPLACDVLVVKSQQHFRAAFAPIACAVIAADSGGFVSPQLAHLPYRKVRRPVWPLDALPARRDAAEREVRPHAFDPDDDG